MIWGRGSMPFTNKPWSSPESDLSADDYAKVCLIDMNQPGKDKVKNLSKLPIKSTPDGPYNINAIHSAAGVIGGARGGLRGVPADEKRKAARKLISLYKEMDEQAPDAVYRSAGEKP